SKKRKTYNSRCSLVVTHPTTNLPVSGLSMGEQTGPRIFHYLWSYVVERRAVSHDNSRILESWKDEKEGRDKWSTKHGDWSIRKQALKGSRPKAD
ncbi:hypothetical protein M440DRAFT_1336096, partial [Trichoderma longibrachiatum ATCC 18648]